jgi:alpha-N-arabinofuranosidase
VLQAATSWPLVAANFRQQLNDYIGSAATNIELVCTENNSNAGSQGRQSTSLVNAVFMADNIGSLLTTEFNAYVWWDLRNGRDTTGDFDPTIYGWRTWGDLGVMDGATNRYPSFYALKMMQHFASPGDTVLPASSDYVLLTPYATLHTDGSLSVMVLNKDTTTNFTGHIVLNGYSAATNATLYFYGVPQDTAVQTGVGNQDISVTNMAFAATNLTLNFPPVSLTVLTFPPAGPLLGLQEASAGANEFVLTLKGEAGAKYLLQNSTNLTTWISVSTNTAPGGTFSLTNHASAGTSLFWRALWLP